MTGAYNRECNNYINSHTFSLILFRKALSNSASYLQYNTVQYSMVCGILCWGGGGGETIHLKQGRSQAIRRVGSLRTKSGPSNSFL